MKNADIVFTGSPKKNREYREKGINSHFLPQFTRLDKFYHAPREKLKKKVLFVANQWPDFPLRKSVEYAKKSGVELEVFGDNWENSLFGEYAGWWKARQIPNDQLKYFYSSADIVLNDTRPDMIEAGFISNRIFDATACKAFVISDYMPEIEEIYGDSVPMYRNAREFKQLIEYYLHIPRNGGKRRSRHTRLRGNVLPRGRLSGKWQRCCKILPRGCRNGSNGFGTGEAMPRAGV